MERYLEACNMRTLVISCGASRVTTKARGEGEGEEPPQEALSVYLRTSVNVPTGDTVETALEIVGSVSVMVYGACFWCGLVTVDPLAFTDVVL